VGGHQSSASGDIDVLIFVVACTRLDRYEELLRQFGGWSNVGVVLDSRDGDRREPHDTFAGVDRRRVERRHRLNGEPYLKLGWAVVDTDELIS